MPSLFRPHRSLASAILLLVAIASSAQTSTPAGSVPLLQPLGLAFDAQGDLFFAEAGNHLIRRLDPSGTLTTVAGAGTEGFSGDGGPAPGAQLDAPHGISLDAAGNLFIADTHNQRIRRIDAVTHIITTVAGTGALGFSGDSGPATSARLASPIALALSANLLYIADSGNHRIRSVDLATGLISTLAGSGMQTFRGDGALASAAALDTPSALALDSAGNLFIADTGNHRVRRVDATTHIITTVAGGTTDSVLARPLSLALIPAGLLIADASQQRILELDLGTGHLTSFAGQGSQSFAGDSGPAIAAMLDAPAGLALAPAGTVAIADTGNQRLRQVASDGTISTVAGLGTLVQGSLSLTGAATQSYGSTALLAALSTTVSSHGSVSLLDITTGSPVLLAQTSLATGLARFALPTLSAGSHRLLATFAGDAIHQSAQSQTLALTVAPIALTATLTTPAAIGYGQAVPSFAATLAGALPADVARLAAALTTTATSTSAPGSYPIHIVLTGGAASNYTLANPDATLTIAKAPVLTTLTQSSSALVAHVATTTVGTPTGSIILLTSAGTRLSTVLLDTTGTATLSAANLPDGAYTLTAIYSGDTDFLSAESPALTFTIGTPSTPPDFSLGLPTLNAQTITSGATAQFAFTIKTAGTTGLAGPILLSTSPLPAGFSANFDPPVIPPGVTSFNLSVITPSALAKTRPPQRISDNPGWITVASLLPLLLLSLPRTRRQLLLASLATLTLCGCGARINSAALAAAQSTATTYPITVTATTTNLDGSVLQHTAIVTLTVQ